MAMVLLISLGPYSPFVKSYFDLQQDYSAFRALILLVIFPDARDVIRHIQEQVLRSKDEEPMVMKKSLADDCTMLAVSVCNVLAQRKFES